MGYFLLTGKAVFEAENVVDLCQKHVATPPVPPSERINTPIPAELEGALMACLEKSRAKRPQTARDLSLLIARCPEANQWSVEDADAWWGRHERGHGGASVPNVAAASQTAGHSQDLTIDLSLKRR